MKTYIIITSYDNRFKHTEGTIFFRTDIEDIDQLVATAMNEIDDSILYSAQEEGEYETLNDFLLEVYGFEITELRIAATIDGVDFYM